MVQEAVAVLSPVLEWRQSVIASAEIASSLSSAARAGAMGVQDATELPEALALAASMVCAATDASQCWLVLCEDGWWASGAATRVLELEEHKLQFPGVLVDPDNKDVPEPSEVISGVVEMARDTLDAGAMASAESLGGLPLLTTEKALFGCLVLQHPSWDLNQALCSLILSNLSNRIGNSQLASLLGVARDGAAPETPAV